MLKISDFIIKNHAAAYLLIQGKLHIWYSSGAIDIVMCSNELGKGDQSPLDKPNNYYEEHLMNFQDENDDIFEDQEYDQLQRRPEVKKIISLEIN